MFYDFKIWDGNYNTIADQSWSFSWYVAETDRFLIMESGIKWSLCTIVTLDSEECAEEVKDVLDSKVLPYLVEIASILIL